MRIWNQFLCLMLLLSGNRPYFSQNSRRGIIDWVWLLTFGGLLPDGKKAFFTWSADSTPFANAFRTFLHYLISISYSCHAFLFYVCNTFTFWKRSETFISVLWQIVDTENQFAMQPAKSQLQPENALLFATATGPCCFDKQFTWFDLPIHKMASRGPRHASSTNCPEFGDQLNGENQLNWTMIWNGRQFQWETSWMCHVSYRTTWIPSQMKVKQHNKTISGIYLTWLALLDHHN